MRMRDRIGKAFGGGQAQRVSGKIVGRGQDGSYIVETASGAKMRAESEVDYSSGSRVTVMAGRILGRTGGGTGKVFEV